jgi:hypothetical protein
VLGVEPFSEKDVAAPQCSVERLHVGVAPLLEKFELTLSGAASEHVATALKDRRYFEIEVTFVERRKVKRRKVVRRK